MSELTFTELIDQVAYSNLLLEAEKRAAEERKKKAKAEAEAAKRKRRGAE